MTPTERMTKNKKLADTLMYRLDNFYPLERDVFYSRYGWIIGYEVIKWEKHCERVLMKCDGDIIVEVRDELKLLKDATLSYFFLVLLSEYVKAKDDLINTQSDYVKSLLQDGHINPKSNKKG